MILSLGIIAWLGASYGAAQEALAAVTRTAEADQAQKAITALTATATATPTPIDTPTPEPSLTSTLTSTPSPTLPSYPAPALAGPEDNAVFRGAKAEINLSWEPIAGLTADDYYVVTVDYIPGKDENIIWHDIHRRKENRLTLPPYLYSLLHTNHRSLVWHVAVMRQIGTAEDGTPKWVSLGPESEKRTLVWALP